MTNLVKSNTKKKERLEKNTVLWYNNCGHPGVAAFCGCHPKNLRKEVPPMKKLFVLLALLLALTMVFVACQDQKPNEDTTVDDQTTEEPTQGEDPTEEPTSLFIAKSFRQTVPFKSLKSKNMMIKKNRQFAMFPNTKCLPKLLIIGKVFFWKNPTNIRNLTIGQLAAISALKIFSKPLIFPKMLSRMKLFVQRKWQKQKGRKTEQKSSVC